MTIRSTVIPLAAALIGVAPIAHAVEAQNVSTHRWAGSWHLDRGASRFRGDITEISQVDRGYRLDLGAVRFTLPDDGRFHPTIAGR